MLPERFVARAVGVKALEAAPNDSLDLTICEWHGDGARVKLRVNVAGFPDGAARTAAVKLPRRAVRELR